MTTQQFRLKKWFPNIESSAHSVLQKYYENIVKFNPSLKLVTAKTLPVADIIHFSDCLNAVQSIFENHKIAHIHDIGTGNAIPGFTIAALHPQTKVTIVEHDKNKCEFYRLSAESLGLKNIEILNARYDSLAPASIQFGIVREFLVLTKALLVLRKCFKKGGILFHIKADGWALELSDVPSQVCGFWSPGLVKEYPLPELEVKFAVLKTEKIAD